MKVKVSPSDLRLITNYTWYISNSGYAATRIGTRIVYMHKMLLPHDGHVDHINGDKLDNRVENLRKANHQLNGMNRGKQVNNTSGYKGVGKLKNRWQARLCSKCIGTYDTKEEAALMYDIAAKKQFGSFAQLNFNLELN